MYSAYHLRSLSSVLKHPLQEVQPRCGSSCGEDGDSPECGQDLVFTAHSEGNSFRINAPRPPSASQPSPFALVLRRPSESTHIPTDSEQIRTRARIAEREVQINALEMKIRDLKATFEAESQEKYAAIMRHFSSRILAVQKETADRLSDVLSRA